MIQVSLTSALAIYSALLFAVILVIWVYTEIAVRHTHPRLAQQFLWKCVFCGYSYLDERADRISQCPRCASFNSVEDEHAKVVKPRALVPAEEPRLEQDLTPARDTSHRKRHHQRRRGPRRRK